MDGRYSWTLNSLFNSPPQHHCPLAVSSHVYIESTHLDLEETAAATATLTGSGSFNTSKLITTPGAYVRFASQKTLADSKLQVSVVDEVEALKVLGENVDQNSLYADYDLRKMFEALDAQYTEQMQQQQQNKSSNAHTRRPIINLGIQYPTSYRGRLPESMARRATFSTVAVRRHVRGFGVASGGLSVTITNSLSVPVYALYLDTIPWHFRFYLHSLLIEVKEGGGGGDSSKKKKKRIIKPSWLHYQPAVDRLRPHHLELLLQLPAASEVEIRFQFDHQFLRWTEYPPDANHGLYITPASVTFFFPPDSTQGFPNFERFLPSFFEQLASGKLGTNSVEDAERRLALLASYHPLRLYTEPVLISMPTPDFSMPYNVVCLVSTVLSIAFGPIYNITTRRTKLTRKYVEESVKAAGEGEGDDKKEKKKRKCLLM